MAELLESGKEGADLEGLSTAVQEGRVEAQVLPETVQKGEVQPEAMLSPTPTLVNSPMKSQEGRCLIK